MITIGTLKLDLVADREPFVHDLYGRWDTFNRTSLEGIVDEILSRYDTEDELIRIESLDLDLGELEEDEFYEQFPRRLAERLDETFASYLRSKEEHPDRIAVVPIRQSWLEVFTYYMSHGYWPWLEEERLTLPELLDKLVRISPIELSHFLREKGKALTIRKRLVFQLDDIYQERLVHVVAPSESSFINAYARFLQDSYPEIKRPEIGKNDYRNAIWIILWGYLLSQDQGYFNRKQMVTYTLRELSGYYSISFVDLLEMLTYDLDKFASTRLFMPELLSLLKDIRLETLSEREFTKNLSLFSLEELKALLVRREKSLTFLSGYNEEQIYQIVEQVIPAESPFVIDYARALDKEKELGMLEGKAGNDFRILKWVFIFEVILGRGGSVFSRHQFAFSVLKELAAHYNLTVMELLGYFYRTLASGLLTAYPAVRELIIALYLNALDDSPADISIYYPKDLKDRLSNSGLCRRFIRSLCEEQIYSVVRQIVPVESHFIIRYAQTLDKGKEQGRLEGRVGGEFRLLKWEFIFLVLFSGPLTAFSRKQFVRLVLGQFSAHYNITVRELISYFHEGTHGEYPWVPEELREIIDLLYEDMDKESPELLFSVWLNEERKAYRLGQFIITGRSDEPLGDLFEYVSGLEKTNPKILLDQLRQLKDIPSSGIRVEEPIEAARIFASLLLFVIREYGLAFPNQVSLIQYLTNVKENRTFGDAARLRLLLHECMLEDMDAFARTMEALLGTKQGKVPELPIRTISPAIYPFNSQKMELLEELYTGATPALRLLVEEVIRLFRLNNFGLEENVWLGWLQALSGNVYRNYSKDGLLFLFWQHLRESVSEEELHKIETFICRHTTNLSELSVFIYQLKNNMDMDVLNGQLEDHGVSINNAGLTIIAVYLPILFHRLGYLSDDRRGFKSRECQVKAIFASQRFVTDEKEIPEQELFLNKVLTGYDSPEPLPRSCDLTENELEMIEQLKKAILMNWDKMRHTSWGGLQRTFIQRTGVLKTEENNWMLTVEERPFDVLLDSIPWNFRFIKSPWMEKILRVKWR